MRTGNYLNLIMITAVAALMASCKTPAPPEPEPAQETGTGESMEKAVDTPEAEDEQKDPRFKAPDDVAAPPADAGKTESGLASKVIKPGTGTEHPAEIDGVEVHYIGWTTDGKMFDSSHLRSKTAVFPLNRVIPGWTEGLQLMVTGETRRFWIPVELAYNGAPGKPAGMLVFDVELMNIIKAPEAPDDVAKPPKKAKKTESGLAFMVLQEGTGTDHPGPASWVTVNYTGWTTNGTMFDSSIVRGKPASFPLSNVIPGWTEGLQLMVKGETRRFWIPVELAYNGAPGKPAGMLVFDVELLNFK
jgi:peptidylprolyl isomerase